jgi:hypothetical protein
LQNCEDEQSESIKHAPHTLALLGAQTPDRHPSAQPDAAADDTAWPSAALVWQTYVAPDLSQNCVLRQSESAAHTPHVVGCEFEHEPDTHSVAQVPAGTVFPSAKAGSQTYVGADLLQ